MGKLSKQNFAIKGMSCAACKGRVERAASSVQGVESVAVQLLQNSMTVLYDEQKCSIEQICAAVAKAGYEAKPIKSSRELNHVDDGAVKVQKRKLIASVILTLILMLFSMGPMIGINVLPQATANADAQLGLCLLIIALNFHYFKNGFKALIHLSPNMDSLVALGATASFLASCAELIVLPEGTFTHDLHRNYSLYFEGVGTILTLVSVGKYFEARAKHRAVDAISKLYDLAPQTVTVRRPVTASACGVSAAATATATAGIASAASASAGTASAGAVGTNAGYEEVTVPLEALEVGDEVVLRSGDRVGVDGVVIEGSGYFDESAITGEAMQVKKGEGDPVTSATFLRHGYVVFKVQKVGEDTTLAKIIALVDDANRQKAPIARLADKVAYYFVPAVIVIALMTFFLWLLEGAPLGQAVNFAVSVLVVSCPCALGLATPTAIMVATGRAASLGVLFKSPEALENLQKIDIMVFDKTGTITEGKMQVLACRRMEAAPDELIKCIEVTLAMEQRSEHPIAQALVTYCQQELSNLKAVGSRQEAGAADAAAVAAHTTKVSAFVNHEGKGIEAEIEGERYYMGSTTFMNQVLYSGQSQIHNLNKYREESENVTVHLFTAQRHLASFALGDDIKRGASDVVELLDNFNVRSILVSGDSVRVVASVAAKVGISTYKAACLPQDKSDFIERLHDKEHVVAMMGDGINDAPSLAVSDVGISIAGSTDIAKSCADVILMKDNLYSLVSAVMLSRLTITNIKENLFWAFIYNIVCIPLAAGVLFSDFGLKLDPMIAACLMSLSSVCVVTNALRLKRCSLDFHLPNGQVMRAEVATPDGTTSLTLDGSDDKTDAIYNSAEATAVHSNNRTKSKSARRERDRELDAELSAAGAHAVDEELQAPELSAAAATLGATVKAEPAAEAAAPDVSSDTRADASAAESTGSQTSELKMSKLIHIEGMHCEHCVRSVTKALSAVPGVEKVDVNLTFKAASVQCAPSVTDEQLKQAVVDDGFEVTSIETA